MQPFKRSDRVADRIRIEAADIFQNRVKDPRIGFITVVFAEVSSDLKHAKIFLSLMQGETRETLNALEHARPFVRRELARRLNLKYAPDISLHIDKSTEEAERILNLIEEANKPDE